LSRDAAKALGDRRPVYALLTAEGISQVGNMMTVVAGPWFVLQTTGSAAKTGLVGAALALGLLVPILGVRSSTGWASGAAASSRTS
jgi:hypothetical protein